MYSIWTRNFIPVLTKIMLSLWRYVPKFELKIEGIHEILNAFYVNLPYGLVYCTNKLCINWSITLKFCFNYTKIWLYGTKFVAENSCFLRENIQLCTEICCRKFMHSTRKYPTFEWNLLPKILFLYTKLFLNLLKFFTHVRYIEIEIHTN